ncbi:hypothetical protein BYT27DRAFT_7333931 [Phlegmacium glaucopus]|nr:hypothetical protein BYT27DRAFT_7333931 [Phlegmacium glaucopus]
MRVCLVVHDSFETAMTVSPSEPILAEAARNLMKDNPTFDVPRSLLQQLEKPGLNKGDRGELIAELLLILASDAAYHKKARLTPRPNTRGQRNQSVTKIEIEPTTSRAVSLESFIKELLAKEQHDQILNVKPAKSRTPTEGKQSFGVTFNESKVYFNHFIKINDPNVIKRDSLWKLIARGAAVLCANGQRGVDIVIPFMYCAKKLSKTNVSAIFIQVKNDATFTTKPNVILFDLMNPYFLRFFDIEEEPLPVIRMVFALASHSPAIEVIPPKHERFPQTAKTQAAEKSSKGSPRYTSYDIWCAKACSDTFGVIKPGDDDTYANLLKVCKVFPAAYTDGIAQHVPSVESMRRKMNPGTATGADHWNEFCGGDIREKVEDTADNVDFSYENEEE